MTKVEQKRDRKTRSRKRVVVPLLPSYVFIDADLIPSIEELTDQLKCRLFTLHGMCVTIDEEALTDMREFDAPDAPEEPDPIKVGAKVHTNHYGFQGMIGKVVGSQGSWCFVEFKDWLLPVKIKRSLLVEK